MLRSSWRIAIILGSVVLSVIPAIHAQSPSGLVFGAPGLALAPNEVLVLIPIRNENILAASASSLLQVGERLSPYLPWSWHKLTLPALPPRGRTTLKLYLPLSPGAAQTALAVTADTNPQPPEIKTDSFTGLLIPSISSLLPPPAVNPLPSITDADKLDLTGKTGAGWAVEVRIAGNILRTTADGEGCFQLFVPINEGTNRFSLRVLGGGVLPGLPIDFGPLIRDTVPPILEVKQPLEGSYYRSVKPLFDVVDSSPVKVGFILDGREFSGADIETPGRHVLRAEAADAAGNTVRTERTFYIDREAPSIKVTGIEDGALAKPPVRPGISCKDQALKSALFWIDGYLWQNSLPVEATGKHNLAARAEDLAGNISHLSISFTIQASQTKSVNNKVSANAVTLPEASRILLSAKGLLTPDGSLTSAVFYLNRKMRVCFSLLSSGPESNQIWTCEGDFGLELTAHQDGLVLQLMDVDKDGVREVVAGRMARAGKDRLAVLRWQAGAWVTVADCQGDDVLFLGGPTGTNQPAVVVNNESITTIWQRTKKMAGDGAQFTIVTTGSHLSIQNLADDPGWRFLQPLLPAKEAKEPPTDKPSSETTVRFKGEIGRDVFALLAQTGGYWPVKMHVMGGYTPLTAMAISGRIGPSWLWPDPDGLFLSDFDRDGQSEPYFTVRDGMWRELRIYDLVSGGFQQVFAKRVKLAEKGYDPGFQFVSLPDCAWLQSGKGEATEIYKWENGRFTKQDGGILPGDRTADQNLLQRDLLAGSEEPANLWPPG